MEKKQEPSREAYPHGRGYGHDYMRGGEVLGGYGYSERDDYVRSRGETEMPQRSHNEESHRRH